MFAYSRMKRLRARAGGTLHGRGLQLPYTGVHSGEGKVTTATRRAWLKRMAAGSVAVALGMAQLRRALAMGSITPGVARVQGDARVNGQPAQRGMEVKPGDVITTGRGAELVVVVGRDAFLVRAQSRIELDGDAAGLLVRGLRIVTGALLSVFEPGKEKRVQTATAVIGIRGTGIYVEIDGARTYVCTCYGEVEIASTGDPSARETVRTTHHEQPRYVMASGAPQMLMDAPVVNHTDAELTMLESLVGRRPPFASSPEGSSGRY